jgi:thiamine biosynthesis lipoprotein
VNATQARPVHKHVEHCMGTVFSFHLVAAPDADAAIADAVAWLHWVDATFSTYQSDSVINRFARGEVGLPDCPAAIAEVLDACARLEGETQGFFSAYAAGRLDPSGYVKGWAIERASDLLVLHGAADHMINGGGDIQCRGTDAAGEPWRLGIADTADSSRIVAVVTGTDFALATSGTAERGGHVVDPHTRRSITALRSVSVYGRHLAQADAYATAALAMGARARAWVDTLDGYEAYFCDRLKQ